MERSRDGESKHLPRVSSQEGQSLDSRSSRRSRGSGPLPSRRVQCCDSLPGGWRGDQFSFCSSVTPPAGVQGSSSHKDPAHTLGGAVRERTGSMGMLGFPPGWQKGLGSSRNATPWVWNPGPSLLWNSLIVIRGESNHRCSVCQKSCVS